MTPINVGPGLQALLANLSTPAELRDEMGKTLGFAVSPDEYERLRKVEEEQRRQEYEWAKKDVSDEELAAAEADAEKTGVYYSHPQVMDFLRRLEEWEHSKPTP